MIYAESDKYRGGGVSLFSRWHRRENNRVRRNQTLPLLYGDELVRLDVGDGVLPPAGPEDFETHRLPVLGFTQAEGDRQLALRQVARPVMDHRKLTHALVG